MKRTTHIVRSGQLDGIQKAHELDIKDAKASVGAKIHDIMSVYADDPKKMYDELHKLADSTLDY